jgi:hypothetical protein
MRALFLALCVSSVPSVAAEKPLSHFEEVALNKLMVMQLVDADALVEGPNGDVALVRTGDKLGKEQATVASVSKGCLSLKVGRSVVALCAESSAAPRS